jgi:REase_DpnII-MboI/Family of unknown function (DUF5763)
MRCKGKTKGGTQCARQAGESGYCVTHDPAVRENREKAQSQHAQQLERFNEVLNTIFATCKAKGWKAYLPDRDKETWRYATVTVEKPTPVGHTYETIVGQFHLTIDSGVKASLTKTSFHSYGLDDLHRSIMDDLGKLPWLESQSKNAALPGVNRVIKLVHRFHAVATQLLRRYGNRDTLRVTDEYDVQDLLHALLKVDFDDVRPEEYSPSKAGASSRLDFLLKSPKVVVEAKMASATLTDKKIGEQLIIDIERYKAHPDCDRLVCLVYDPEHHIRNPAGLERDLSRKEETLEVFVVVVPK